MARKSPRAAHRGVEDFYLDVSPSANVTRFDYFETTQNGFLHTRIYLGIYVLCIHVKFSFFTCFYKYIIYNTHTHMRTHSFKTIYTHTHTHRNTLTHSIDKYINSISCKYMFIHTSNRSVYIQSDRNIILQK